MTGIAQVIVAGFIGRPTLPRIDLVSPAKEDKAAMSLFLGHGARFKATDSNLPAFCTIDGVMVLG